MEGVFLWQRHIPRQIWIRSKTVEDCFARFQTPAPTFLKRIPFRRPLQMNGKTDDPWMIRAMSPLENCVRERTNLGNRQVVLCQIPLDANTR